MADTITLAVLGGTVLTEGIKFLYGQASDIIKRWKDRKVDKTTDRKEGIAAVTSVEMTLPSVFGGQLNKPSIDFDMVEALAPSIETLREALTEHANSAETLNVKDTKLLSNIDSLRNILEQIFHQHISFIGESRPATGSVIVSGAVTATHTSGLATGVEADSIQSGTVEGKVEAGVITKSGKAIGVKVGNIGK
ncbi:MAG: hypothetical protein ABIN94_22755 [Ferruginibacter sp.]